jgi:hypothetical protein
MGGDEKKLGLIAHFGAVSFCSIQKQFTKEGTRGFDIGRAAGLINGCIGFVAERARAETGITVTVHLIDGIMRAGTN